MQTLYVNVIIFIDRPHCTQRAFCILHCVCNNSKVSIFDSAYDDVFMLHKERAKCCSAPPPGLRLIDLDMKFSLHISPLSTTSVWSHHEQQQRIMIFMINWLYQWCSHERVVIMRNFLKVPTSQSTRKLNLTTLFLANWSMLRVTLSVHVNSRIKYHSAEMMGILHHQKYFKLFNYCHYTKRVGWCVSRDVCMTLDLVGADDIESRELSLFFNIKCNSHFRERGYLNLNRAQGVSVWSVPRWQRCQ